MGFCLPSLLCALMGRGLVFSPWLKINLIQYSALKKVSVHILRVAPDSHLGAYVSCFIRYLRVQLPVPDRSKIHLCLSRPGDLEVMLTFSRRYRKCFMMLGILGVVALAYITGLLKLRLWATTGMTLVQMRWVENKTFSNHFDSPQTLEPNCQPVLQ